MTDYILIFTIVFAGSVIQGAASFGFSILVMSLLPFILPLRMSAALSAISAFFIGFYVCLKIKKNLQIKYIITPLAISLIVLPIGAYMLNVCDEVFLKKLLGSVIILFTIVTIFNPGQRVNLKPTMSSKIITGTISGLFAGMFNIGGPPMVFYYLGTIKDNLSYKAALEFTFAVTALVSIGFHIYYGNIQPAITGYVLLCLVASITGTALGLKVFVRLDEKALKKFVYILMTVLGIILVIK